MLHSYVRNRMTTVPPLGAINKTTGAYVYAKIANKKDEYICPECDKDLILCRGEIRIPHFRHKIDSVNPCHYYSSPNESQIHKDAKLLMKSLLENKVSVSFIRRCCGCNQNEEFEIPEITESSTIQLEYRFEYKGTKIADVAYIDDGDILCIFEIYNTHKTRSENRPEPWFEIEAMSLINMTNDNNLTSFRIPCIRCEKCDICIEKENVKKFKIKTVASKLREWTCEDHVSNHGTITPTQTHQIIDTHQDKDQLMKTVRNNHVTRVIELEQLLIRAQKINETEHWQIDDGVNEEQYKIPLKNIHDELEIKLIENDIKYLNNNDTSFIVTNPITNDTITMDNISSFRVGHGHGGLSSIYVLKDWYFNYKKNIINVEIRRDKLYNELFRLTESQDTVGVNCIIKIIISEKFKVPMTEKVNFVKNGVKYSSDNQGYIFIHPRTKIRIKYSFKQKMLILGKWERNIPYYEIIRWYNSNSNSAIDRILNGK